MDKPQKVVIIGAGLAALVHALCLRKRGINAVLYEHRQRSAVSGGHLGLTPNALRVLDHIGVYDKVRTQGFNFEHLVFANGKAQVLGKFSCGSQKRFNFFALRIRRSVLRNALLEEVEACDIEIHYGWHCKGIKEETANAVSVEFTNGEVISGDIVVGADGIHSSIRPHIKSDSDPIFSGDVGIGGFIDKSKLDQVADDLQYPAMVYGPTGFFGIMPLDLEGTTFAYFATQRHEDMSREEWDAFIDDKPHLEKIMKDNYCNTGWPKVVESIVNSTPTETLACWPHYKVPQLDNYRSTFGRVIIIGDAAHAIPPSGGQGAAMAFEDAETLAYALSRYTDLQILDRWQTHRLERIRRVTAYTEKSRTTRMKMGPWGQLLKEYVIWAVFLFAGSTASIPWLYHYNAESVLSALAD